MSDVAENDGNMDFSKMKVNHLKKLLKSRGLSVTGVKQDLIERLQSSEAAAEALLEGSEVGEDGFDEELDKELDESALMADEEQHSGEMPVGGEDNDNKEPMEIAEDNKKSEDAILTSVTPQNVEESKEQSKTEVKQNGDTEMETQNSKKQKVSLKTKPLTLSEADKKKARAERFGTLQKNQDSAMVRRAERFNLIKNSTTKAADSSNGQSKVSSTTTNEVLKRRAERFGILSPAEASRQRLEKLQARKLRFQQTQSTTSNVVINKISTTAASPITTSTTSGSNITTTTTTTTKGTKTATGLSLDERKKLRAERFKIKA